MSDGVNQEKLHSVGANVGTLMMAVGGIAAANEAVKAVESKDHTIKHGLHAGLGAAAATVGYEIAKMSSAESDTATNTSSSSAADAHGPPSSPPAAATTTTTTTTTQPRHTRSSSSLSSSASSTKHKHGHHHHHKLHLAEEVVAAWAIVKKALGDKDHKTTHLVEELLGLVGLYGEAKEHAKH